MKRKSNGGSNVRPGNRPLYQALDFFQFRAPLLPTDFYFELTRQSGFRETLGSEQGPPKLIGGTRLEDWASWTKDNPLVNAALAIASIDLVDALERDTKKRADSERIQSRLLRYLIRTSTRPTPFGLFAGVAMGRWAETTRLRIGSGVQSKTRPDMDWLLRLVGGLESRPEVRQQLAVYANPAAFIHSGRVFLAERASLHEGRTTEAVSVNCTAVVRHILSIARTPILWTTLAEEILSKTDRATPNMVEKLLTELWDASLLLTDLRPPLTHLDPAGYVLERLRRMRNVAQSSDALEKILTVMESWDAEPKKTAKSYREIVSLITQVDGKEPRSAIQVDSALTLTSNHLSHAVAEEVARAAELLMRISPWPDGPAYLHDYRRAFQSRFGDREIPVLQLLDPSAGLGPPLAYSNATYQSAFKARGLSAAGSQLLLDMAYRALRDKEAILQIDDGALKLLETSPCPTESVPTSLDIYASVAAASAEAVDRGEFKVALGPNLGAAAAGRNMGRFAGLLGREAQDALERAARTEEALRPDEIWAELTYLPQRLRSSNVTIRPAVRRFEIAWGITSSLNPANTIPVNELVVGIEGGRFYLRWTHSSAEVVVCMGHMLNYARAPMVCRLLSDIGRDRLIQLSGFSWGPASNFPFLPRVEYGRIVLRPAQWRIQAATFARQFLHHENTEFLSAVTNWRAEWKVPRHVYLSEQDNRLLLDLDNPLHCEELRRNGRALRPGDRLVLEEVFPALEDSWVQSEQGHHVAEIVVSLVRRPSRQPASVQRFDLLLESNVSGSSSQGIAEPVQPPVVEKDGAVRQRLRPPGSEWLFIKLYCNPKTIEDLLTGPVRDFTSLATATELSDSWFFLRYSDPEPHIRVRFAGEPGRLTGELLPELCKWASRLMDEEKCLRFTLETYEREVERYGGFDGISIAELVFFHDAWAAVELLHLAKSTQMTLDRVTLALLSLDALLDGLGLNPEARLSCCRKQSTARKEASTDFQNKKGMLRKLLGQSDSILGEPGGERLLQILVDLRKRLRVPAAQLQQIQEVGKLTRPLDVIYTNFVHMHLNRMGVSGATETRVIALLWRVHQSLSRSPLDSAVQLRLASDQSA